MADSGEVSSRAPYQDEPEEDEGSSSEESWGDDSGARAVDRKPSEKSVEEFPGSNPFDIDKDDPLRNRNVPEKDIAKRIMSEYLE